MNSFGVGRSAWISSKTKARFLALAFGVFRRRTRLSFRRSMRLFPVTVRPGDGKDTVPRKSSTSLRSESTFCCIVRSQRSRPSRALASASVRIKFRTNAPAVRPGMMDPNSRRLTHCEAIRPAALAMRFAPGAGASVGREVPARRSARCLKDSSLRCRSL